MCFFKMQAEVDLILLWLVSRDLNLSKAMLIERFPVSAFHFFYSFV